MRLLSLRRTLFPLNRARLFRQGGREAGGAGSPVLQRGGGGAEGGGQHYFGETTDEARRRPWSAWADSVRVDGCVAIATTDGEHRSHTR